MPFHSAALDVSSLALITLRDVSRISPVPYLQEAATLALGIVTIIQVRGYHALGLFWVTSIIGHGGVSGEFTSPCKRRLRACARYHRSILQGWSTCCRCSYYPELSQVNFYYQRAVSTTDRDRTLTSIYNFAQRQSKRTIIIRLINHRADRNKILEYRESLRQALDVFGVRYQPYLCVPWQYWIPS